MSVEDILKERGFIKYKTCSCDGFVTEVYRKPEYELRWRKYAGKFLLKRNKQTLNGWAVISKLESYLNEVIEKAV